MIPNEPSSPTWATFKELHVLARAFTDQVDEQVYSVWSERLVGLRKSLQQTYAQLQADGDWKEALLRRPSCSKLAKVLAAQDGFPAKPNYGVNLPFRFFLLKNFPRPKPGAGGPQGRRMHKQKPRFKTKRGFCSCVRLPWGPPGLGRGECLRGRKRNGAFAYALVWRVASRTSWIPSRAL